MHTQAIQKKHFFPKHHIVFHITLCKGAKRDKLTWVGAGVSDNLSVIEFERSPGRLSIKHLRVIRVQLCGWIRVKRGGRVGVAVGWVDTAWDKSPVLVALSIVTLHVPDVVRQVIAFLLVFASDVDDGGSVDSGVEVVK